MICADNKKIIGNFAVAFATAWLSATAVGLGNEAFWIALINAVVLGMLSAGNEMIKQAGGEGTNIQKMLSRTVVFNG